MPMPPAWVAFLMAAETYIDQYGGTAGAVAALHQGLDAGERREVGQFLRDAASGGEGHCRSVTALADPVLAENAFRPVPCLPFYAEAHAAFAAASGEGR